MAACAGCSAILALAMLGLGLAGFGKPLSYGGGYLIQSPVAAGLMLALSLALLLGRGRPGAPRPVLGLVLVVLAAGVSLGSVVAYALGWSPAWVLPEGGALPALRLSLLTSWSVLALAVSYLLGPARPDSGWRFRQLGALIALLPLSLGALVLVSYPEGAPLLNGAASTPMSLPTAVMSGLLGLALLLTAGTDTWPLALFSAETGRAEPGTGARWLSQGALRVFLLLALSILLLGSFYLRAQVRAARARAQKELAATADAKARAISEWFRERQGDAEQIHRSAILQKGILRFLGGAEEERPALREWLASLNHAYRYQEVAIYDGHGARRLASHREGLSEQEPQPPEQVQAALASREVRVVDLHRRRAEAPVHLCFWIPIGVPAQPGRPAQGALVLQVDAREFLFPLIEESANPGTSMETLLVRAEAGTAVYLSDLRQRPDSALRVRVSLAERPDDLLAQAALGGRTLSAGQDYRGRMVIAVLRKVTGTPWAMMTKVDEAEIFGPLRRWAWMAGTCLLGLVLLLAMGIGLMVRQADSRRILAQLAFARERRALSERFSKAFSTSPDAMSINRLADGVYLDINEGFTRITGYQRDELIGRSSREEALGLWVRNSDRALLVAGLRAHGEVVDLEARFRMKDGRIIVGLMSAKVLEFDQQPCLLAVTRDITQFRKNEEERRLLAIQLNQAQKLESLGALAGGVAHDMNNVLGAILSLASAHQAQLDPEDALAGSFQTIISACLRGRGVVKSLLYFARKELEEAHPIDLNALVQEVLQLLAHTTLQRMKLETELQEGLWTVQGDAGALSHALMNLCVNAMDAMPEGGTLRLATENLPEGTVRLAVTDTGEGMTPEVLEKAMEPFFTTKPVGKGTGLGLAMVFGTVQAHGGTVEIRSEPGQGTTVLLGFPTVMAVPRAPEPPAPSSEMILEPLRILLVDDDELIRASVAPMLGFFGHQVSTAEGGREALRVLGDGLKVDLVILDLNMPDLNGIDTLACILERLPEQPVLLASGYSDGDPAALAADHPNVSFIQKPFSVVELQRKLGEMTFVPGQDHV